MGDARGAGRHGRYGFTPSLEHLNADAAGGGSRGRAGDDGGGLFDQEQATEKRNRGNEDELSAYVEAYAPELAKQLGVSEDEARRQLTSGVSGDEGPMHWLGRQTIGRLGLVNMQAPEGERLDSRLAKVKGMSVRADRGIEANDRAGKLAHDLYSMREGTDSLDELGGAVTGSLRDAGAHLPEGENLKLRHEPPKTIAELYGSGDTAGAERLAGIMHRASASNTDSSPQERILNRTVASLVATGMPQDQAERVALDTLYNKGGGQPQRGAAESALARLNGDPNTVAQLAGEEEDAAKAKANGLPAPPAPMHEHMRRLQQQADMERAPGRAHLTDYGNPELDDFFTEALSAPGGRGPGGLMRGTPGLGGLRTGGVRRNAGPPGPLLPQ